MIYAGTGATVKKLGETYVVGAKAPTFTFGPAFALRYYTDFFEVGYGTVNDIEPTIGGKLISGVDAGGNVMGVPRLQIPDTQDVEGRLWVCVQVTVDEAGGIVDDGVQMVVETDALKLQNLRGEVGLYPIGLLRANEELWQLAYFNLRHAVVRPRTGNGFRHFFWAT
jgi:hypothetical protein